MTKEEILLKCKSNRNYYKECVFKKQFPKEYSNIEKDSYPNNFSFQQKLYHWLYDIKEIPVCKTCGNLVKFINPTIGYRKHCCNSCTRKDKNVQIKQKRTCFEKYGNENYSNREQSSKKWKQTYYKQKDEIIAKHKKTCLEKYGDENYRNDEQIQKTNIKKYGINRFTKTKEFVEKSRKTKKEKHGYYGYTNREKCKETMINRYGIAYSCMLPQTRTYSNDSKPNLEFAELLDKNNIAFEREFPVGRYIYDFKVGNILVEINPTVTHNNHMNIFDKEPLDEKYHLNKTNVAKENGYFCLHVWDWDDKDKIIKVLSCDKNVYNYPNNQNIFYCDLSKPVDFDFEINGYILEKTIDPTINWYNTRTRCYIISQDCDYGKMISGGYLPIYDCGYVVYVKK